METLMIMGLVIMGLVIMGLVIMGLVILANVVVSLDLGKFLCLTGKKQEPAPIIVQFEGGKYAVKVGEKFVGRLYLWKRPEYVEENCLVSTLPDAIKRRNDYLISKFPKPKVILEPHHIVPEDVIERKIADSLNQGFPRTVEVE